MKIVLSICTDEKTKVHKTLNDKLELIGTIKEETDILNPTITIEGNELEKYNYFYVEEFKRYYFITGVTIVQNGVYKISGHVDVLNTYKENILNLYAIVSNTEEIGKDKYLNSNAWVTKVKDTTEIKNFPNGLLDSGEFILITAGG